MSTAITPDSPDRDDAASTEKTATRSGQISGAEIVFDHVSKVYPRQKTPAVDDLSMTIPAGEIVMLVGPSGGGKTTTLKLINRLIEPTSGLITIDGEDVRKKNVNELRRHIGYVIQGGSLLPHLTVAQNIALVPGLLKWEKKRVAERVEELLELVGLEPERYRNRFPRELSGGQQQRVGVARGLAADPPVLLMDEPFGAVDPITRQRLQDELLSIQEELQKTIVFVTHDVDEAIKLGDRIAIFSDSAHLAQYDTPEAILAAPANSFVEDFIGSGSSLRQLSLSRVNEIELATRPVAVAGSSSQEAVDAASNTGWDDVVILDQHRRPLDWIGSRQALASPTLPRRKNEELPTIDRRATLNDALDSMLASAHGGVIVTGQRDEYLGLLMFDAVTEYIRQSRDSARSDASDDQPQQVSS